MRDSPLAWLRWPRKQFPNGGLSKDRPSEWAIYANLFLGLPRSPLCIRLPSRLRPLSSGLRNIWRLGAPQVYSNLQPRNYAVSCLDSPWACFFCHALALRSPTGQEHQHPLARVIYKLPMKNPAKKRPFHVGSPQKAMIA